MTSVPQDATAYNTAYLSADRSGLYEAFDVDPALDAGRIDPETGARVAPPDLDRRRRAVLSFYSERCGRCAQRIAADDPADDEERGFALSVGRIADAAEPWALDELVPVCEPCYDLLEPTDPVAVGTVATRFREAPQFPAWLCDPRVAVERVPLEGRELFVREQLDADLDARFDFGVNDAVADAAVLALPTSASRAVGFGVALLSGRVGTEAGSDADPLGAWDECPSTEKEVYRRRVLAPRAIADGDRWWLGEPADDPRGEELSPGVAFGPAGSSQA